MRTQACLVFLALVAPSLAACSERSGDDSNIAQVDADDSAMDAAVQTARATVGEFTRAIQSPPEGASLFGVKKAYTTRDGAREHIWISSVRFESGVFKGVVGNNPANVQDLKLGDPAEVRPEELSDWMYMQGDDIVGGYTIRVLYDRASPEERRRMESDGVRFRGS